MAEGLAVLRAVHDRLRRGRRVAVATVVRTDGSAPRAAGACLALVQAPDGTPGEVLGSVSGGCVESAVHELACEVLADGRPRQARYGTAQDDPFAPGLTCGGTIEVRVALADEDVLRTVLAAVDEQRPVAVATALTPGSTRRVVVEELRHDGSLGSGRLDAAVVDAVRGRLAAGSSGVLRLGADGDRRADDLEVLVEVFAPAPRWIVFGAVDVAAALSRVAAFLGFHVTVCDARPAFTTAARFPDAHEVVVDWPHRYLQRTTVDASTVLTVLTHDPKFDVPLLQVALPGPAGVVGAMGSRRTHADRLERLREAGLTAADLARLRSPVGLDLGARTPEETAVSIAAEVVAVRGGGTGRPLRDTRGRIHHEQFDAVVAAAAEVCA
ncbi:XdhC family protein [Kineococcus sp. TBRC 1896]|uniref:XdhC family protein n=1 Tax=Kineococcus mangrovi TaxID=1660183 RepID=A0ABV4HYX0_9ACTN